MGGTADHRRLSVDDALAPIPAVPAPTISWAKSTHSGRSLRLTLSIRLALCLGYSEQHAPHRSDE